jgi:hypothetical protein
MQDLLANFIDPAVMDVKMGVRYIILLHRQTDNIDRQQNRALPLS